MSEPAVGSEKSWHHGVVPSTMLSESARRLVAACDERRNARQTWKRKLEAHACAIQSSSDGVASFLRERGDGRQEIKVRRRDEGVDAVDHDLRVVPDLLRRDLGS